MSSRSALSVAVLISYEIIVSPREYLAGDPRMAPVILCVAISPVNVTQHYYTYAYIMEPYTMK